MGTNKLTVIPGDSRLFCFFVSCMCCRCYLAFVLFVFVACEVAVILRFIIVCFLLPVMSPASCIPSCVFLSVLSLPSSILSCFLIFVASFLFLLHVLLRLSYNRFSSVYLIAFVVVIWRFYILCSLFCFLYLDILLIAYVIA